MKIEHSEEEGVAAILNEKMSAHRETKAFLKIINIEKCNVERINNPVDIKAVTCEMCNCTYSKKNIHRHQKKCCKLPWPDPDTQVQEVEIRKEKIG